MPLLYSSLQHYQELIRLSTIFTQEQSMSEIIFQQQTIIEANSF